MKIYDSWLEITKLAIRVFKNYKTGHERKVRQRLFVSVKIDSRIAKLTVWHDWLTEYVWLEAAKLTCRVSIDEPGNTYILTSV